MEKSKDRIDAEQMLEKFKANPNDYGADKQRIIALVETFLSRYIWKNDREMWQAVYNLICPDNIIIKYWYHWVDAQMFFADKFLAQADITSRVSVQFQEQCRILEKIKYEEQQKELQKQKEEEIK